MGFLSAPKLAPPPPPPTPPTMASPIVQESASQTAARAAAAEGQGFNDTVKSSPEGAPAPSLAKATLGG